MEKNKYEYFIENDLSIEAWCLHILHIHSYALKLTLLNV